MSSKNRMSNQQKGRLIELVEDNKHILYGKCEPFYGNILRKKTWEKIADELNCIGHKKDAEKWKKSFADIKLSATTKFNRLKAAKENGESEENAELIELTEQDNIVCKILESVGYGNAYSEETDVCGRLNVEKDIDADHKDVEDVEIDDCIPNPTTSTEVNDEMCQVEWLDSPVESVTEIRNKQSSKELITKRKSKSGRSNKCKIRVRDVCEINQRESLQPLSSSSSKPLEKSLELSDKTCLSLDKLTAELKRSNDINERSVANAEKLTICVGQLVNEMVNMNESKEKNRQMMEKLSVQIDKLVNRIK